MTDTNTIIADLRTLFNDPTKLTDPYNGTRVGDFFFDQDARMNLRKYMPKGMVTDGTSLTDRYTFGTAKRRKTPTINIYFYTQDGDKDFNTNYKNRSLVSDYLEKIEDTINNNLSSINGGHIPQYGSIGPIRQDPGNKTFWGVKTVIFTYIKP